MNLDSAVVICLQLHVTWSGAHTLCTFHPSLISKRGGHMKPASLFSALVGAVALSALGTTAGYADLMGDPLHGICAGCVDQGTNTPLVSQPFSFSVSPGPQTGTFLLEVLEPSTAPTNNFT